MENIETLTEESQRDYIIEILKEAHSYDLQLEVEQTAIDNFNNFKTSLEAYEFAYHEWIK